MRVWLNLQVMRMQARVIFSALSSFVFFSNETILIVSLRRRWRMPLLQVRTTELVIVVFCSFPRDGISICGVYILVYCISKPSPTSSHRVKWMAQRKSSFMIFIAKISTFNKLKLKLFYCTQHTRIQHTHIDAINCLLLRTFSIENARAYAPLHLHSS